METTAQMLVGGKDSLASVGEKGAVCTSKFPQLSWKLEPTNEMPQLTIFDLAIDVI